MILSQYAFIKIAPNNFHYWKSRGYSVGRTGGRGGINNAGNRLKVKVEHLSPCSNVRVSCKCERCGKKYIQRFGRDTSICYPCRKLELMKSSRNPSWRPDIDERKRYTTQVRHLSEKIYRENKEIINPLDLPRVRAKREAFGYQLDHIISIKRGYEEQIPVEKIASIDNLQMLLWEDNHNKLYK